MTLHSADEPPRDMAAHPETPADSDRPVGQGRFSTGTALLIAAGVLVVVAVVVLHLTGVVGPVH